MNDQAGERREPFAFGCQGCGRVAKTSGDLLRQGCEGRHEELVPASALEERDRVLGELRQALALARSVIFAEEEMSVEVEHIIDAALGHSNQGGEADESEHGSDETRPTLSPSGQSK